MGCIQQIASLILWFTISQVIVSEPLLLDESFNKSLEARSIDILAASSLSKRQSSWLDAVTKGARLLCRLENPDFLDDQSTVTTNDLLWASGWVDYHQDVDPKISVILGPFFVQEGIGNDENDLIGGRWDHDEESTNSQGQTVPATKGRYVNLYNVKGGYLIAYNNFGPAWMVRNEEVKILPDIKAWSDVTFIEWQDQAGNSGVDVKGLKYVIRYDVVSTATTSIVNRAVGGLYRISWPGVTLVMSDPRGQAILGSPNGVGVAYLLATHKEQLGQKTVESVQVWTRAVQEEFGLVQSLYIAFKIGPVASSSTTALASSIPIALASSTTIALVSSSTTALASSITTTLASSTTTALASSTTTA